MSELKSKIEDLIQKHIISETDYIIGFSNLEGLVPENLIDLKYGITIGIKLDDKIIDGIVEGPTTEYKQHYHDINALLNNIASDVKDMLVNMGHQAEFQKSTLEWEEEDTIPDYYDTLAVEFSHKTAATRSGLGWIGKTDLFISHEFGPRLRLVTVFTDRELDTGTPVEESQCGECVICVEKCPTDAATGNSWTAGMPRQEIYDAHKCRIKAKELARVRIGLDEVICGICVAVCPKGIGRHPKT
jgi:epoxyqueuosine reductase QueG